MIKAYILDEIAKVFEVPSMTAAIWAGKDYPTVFEVWLAQLMEGDFPPVNEWYHGMIVAVIHTDKGSKGLIMIPSMYPVDENGNQDFHSLRPIKLEDWDDPVLQILRKIKLFPTGQPTVWDQWDAYQHRYYIQFSSAICEGAISVRLHTLEENHPLDELRDAIRRVWILPPVTFI